MDILPKFLLLSSVDSGREDLLGLVRLYPDFPVPNTLELSAQSALCSVSWPHRCSIEVTVVRFTFLCVFSPQLAAAHMGYPSFFLIPRDYWRTLGEPLVQDKFRELCSCLEACASCWSSNDS